MKASFLWVVLLFTISFLIAAPSYEERRELSFNEQLIDIKKKLDLAYLEVDALFQNQKTDEFSFNLILEEVNRLRKEQEKLEKAWKERATQENMSYGEPFSLWDEQEISLSQLVMEYGSSDYLYIIPPELAGIKIHLHSNIPIPRPSWGDLLEALLSQLGFGLKKVNNYARQLYLLKHDLSIIDKVAFRREQLSILPSSSRICYILFPYPEQIRAVAHFFEKFSDGKQTVVHLLSNKIALFGRREELERLLDLYDKVWGDNSGKQTKVIPVSKLSVKEMEKILSTFFLDNLESVKASFDKREVEKFSIFPLIQSNSLVCVGPKESIERAEKVVRDTEAQLEDPAEITVFLYTCRHSDPDSLAQILEKVYVSLLSVHQDAVPKETNISYVSPSPGNTSPPDGYAPVPPLIVAPNPIQHTVSGKINIEKGGLEHFIPDSKTGTILMTVRRDALEKIKNVLKQIDIPVKMVEIEVLLFERRINSQNNFGMNMLKLGKPRNGLSYTSESGPLIKDDLLSSRGIAQFLFNDRSDKAFLQFDLAYYFLMTQEDIQLHEAPSITTANHTSATISVVREISIDSGAAPVDTNKGVVFEKAYQRAQYGSTLTLTPAINGPSNAEPNGSVTLQIKITFDTMHPHPNNDRPSVERRQIENEVSVLDGETIILGGLRSKSRGDFEEKIPFLGYIPGIGKLFGSSRLADQDTEMFFFITPKIIASSHDELAQLEREIAKKRAGDIPEFLEKLQEARDREKKGFFKKGMKLFFTHE